MDFRLGPLFLLLAGVLWLALPGRAGVPVEVDTALVVAVDISDSVSAERYSLQMEGIARALEDPGVIDAIMSGPRGGIGFALVEWTDTAELTIPWRVIQNRADAFETARVVRGLTQKVGEYTCVSRMLSFIRERVTSELPLSAFRVVIDVSGDGIDNCRDPADTLRERDLIVSGGAQINGLPILVAGENDTVGSGAYRAPGFGLEPLLVTPGTAETTLVSWYREHVIGGPGSFVIPAQGFEDFGRAFRQKFVTEISNVQPLSARRVVERDAIPFARRLIAAWRHDYYHHRPHSKLGWLTPAGYAERWQENDELEGRSSGAFNDDRIPVAPG